MPRQRLRKLKSGGGWQAIRYSLVQATKIGPLKFWRALRSKNACKTCALGMGGQLGGMVNEAGHFPEVCKKSVQAMAADMRGRIEPRFFETFTLEQLATLSPRELELLGRLADPLIAGPDDTHYRVATWEEAYEATGNALKASKPERSVFYASGRSSNEAGFLLQLLGRAHGTNHVTNCSYYCHQASSTGLKEALGVATATVSLEDLDKCDMVFVIGGNPPSNHPRLMTKLMEVRQRGGKIIVVNPLKELGMVNFKVPSRVKSMLFGSEIASNYLQVAIGGDIALMTGIAKRLLEHGGIDRAFIAASTSGFDELKALVESTSWETISLSSGLDRGQIEDVADAYAAADQVIFSWTMGITHHEHGVENVRWIVNVAALRGMIGKSGAGLLPIRGHSNVQGMGTMGVSPNLSKAAVENLAALGLKPPNFAGYDTLAGLEAAGQGDVDFALCLGGNLYGASPDSPFTHRALGEIDMVAYLTTSLNTGHVLGRGKTTVVFPVQARDEEAQSTTQESMFSFIRLSDGGPPRLDGPRSEVEILAELGHRDVGSDGTVNWLSLANHEAIRKLIARLVPGLDLMRGIGETKKEFEIPGRILHKTGFGTADGKVALTASSIPALPALGASQLRLMTVRSEGQFNTVVYEEADIYRGQERRDVILMCRSDIVGMGLKNDQPVTVHNAVGTMQGVRVREFDIVRGCAAMYYPEANCLVPRDSDARSKTPAFKNVLVTLTPTPAEQLLQLSSLQQRPQAAKRGNLKSC
ncbi:MAG: FdhF/YdeP family oxidoreductase [Fimbriimonadaceae bacterium]